VSTPIANVNLIKGERRKQEGKPPRDADACWGAKGNRLVAGKDGKRHKAQGTRRRSTTMDIKIR